MLPALGALLVPSVPVVQLIHASSDAPFSCPGQRRCYPFPMKFGVLVFPGSNCDHDTFNVARTPLHSSPSPSSGTTPQTFRAATPSSCPAALPTVTTCAPAPLARFAPIMEPVKKFAHAGGPVLGICNGFQILCEAGLLPGALMRNAGQRYICKQVHLRTETADSAFTTTLQKGQVLQMPIGHMEGNYFCDEPTLAALQQEDRIAFRYSTTPPATSPPPPTQTAPSPTSPESSTGAATSSA